MQLLIVFILFLGFSVPGLSADAIDPNASGVEFLMSYPRCGTNLLTAYIQEFTAKPVGVAVGTISPLATNRLQIALNPAKKTLYRGHHGIELKPWNKNGNKLICIVRNYRECISREHRKKSTDKLLHEAFHKNPTFQHYMDNLRVFDEWDQNNRLLIYYEDLILHPVQEVKRVLAFLGEDSPENLTEDRLSQISEKTLGSYHIQHIRSGGSHSKGKDLLHHSKNMSPRQLKRWDEVMKKLSPALWDSYLKRYEYNASSS